METIRKKKKVHFRSINIHLIWRKKYQRNRKTVAVSPQCIQSIFFDRQLYSVFREKLCLSWYSIIWNISVFRHCPQYTRHWTHCKLIMLLFRTFLHFKLVLISSQLTVPGLPGYTTTRPWKKVNPDPCELNPFTGGKSKSKVRPQRNTVKRVPPERLKHLVLHLVHAHLHREVVRALLVFPHFRESYHQAFLNALGEVAEASIHTLRHELKDYKEDSNHSAMN